VACTNRRSSPRKPRQLYRCSSSGTTAC
jgi:hypothetical protein